MTTYDTWRQTPPREFECPQCGTVYGTRAARDRCVTCETEADEQAALMSEEN